MKFPWTVSSPSIYLQYQCLFLWRKHEDELLAREEHVDHRRKRKISWWMEGDQDIGLSELDDISQYSVICEEGPCG